METGEQATERPRVLNSNQETHCRTAADKINKEFLQIQKTGKNPEELVYLLNKPAEELYRMEKIRSHRVIRCNKLSQSALHGI